MTAVLYRRERELLNYIVQFQEQHGYSPTLREMADAMGRNSVSTIHALIRSMVDKGYIQKVDGNNRTLKVLKRDNIGLLMGSTPKAIGPTMMLPLMGYIAAGQPLEPHTDPDASFPVASTMLSGKKTSYVLQVKGNSMIDDGILDGDYVVIEKSATANNGDIVVALVDDKLATLKRFYKEDDRVVLKPANSQMDPIYPSELQIQGIVVSLVRKFGNSSS
ncbi:MAG: repressor LexA [Candidatus Levybacteria bacterium RIFCSPHIGHO2_02_FULL_40_18]|nr:MAG: repressor LexA [Candidatus Levybacteria bacterium RIFCSPHIGHO2_01_FULL_40_58]OGH27300.1 MAG: repressor LexA [Candidatus Levybacteria bacterium RIFCSPHIGHO2_02_FULL_40_18]OGH30933.1 MAG: repressor LexA [Candidatus Levybacteria bacterium RIFCSPHIGHO2_12_FULL_40_31]OGH40944.1 MAG: repressor LexA [Candidatus Levybacteria bacterium RIFCSPLOWO2_01_FULL_40_64]OGH48979.1 MAG: repressor LexA [Candidatus Levybacteria bacterium RIFCSPLOWO2_02_FULL_41_11]OGH53720.1 MAG: repressor LexA [Candidatus 